MSFICGMIWHKSLKYSILVIKILNRTHLLNIPFDDGKVCYLILESNEKQNLCLHLHEATSYLIQAGKIPLLCTQIEFYELVGNLTKQAYLMGTSKAIDLIDWINLIHKISARFLQQVGQTNPPAKNFFLQYPRHILDFLQTNLRLRRCGARPLASCLHLCICDHETITISNEPFFFLCEIKHKGFCHTRLHLGFSANLRIQQVPACKMEPQSGRIMWRTPPNHPTTHPPTNRLT